MERHSHPTRNEECSSTEKDLRIKAKIKKNTKYTRAVLELIPGYIISAVLSRSREVIFCVYIPLVRLIFV